MIIHNEWMSDSNYFGDDYPNNILLSDGVIRFEKQKTSLEGRDALIDNQSERIVVQNHTNPINQSKYDKKCSFNINTVAKKGSILKFDKEDWLILSSLYHKYAYYVASVCKCNQQLKFLDKTSILSTIISIPCVETSSSKATLDENKYITELSNSLVIKVQLNPQTLNIYEGQRFILGRKVYIVSGLNETDCDFITNTGVLTLNMDVTEKSDKDDFENGIAWNKEDVINDYKIIILNGSTASLKIGENINLNTQITNNNIEVTPKPELIYTSSNEEICFVNADGKITGVMDGNCNIEICLKLEPTIKSTIAVSIVSVVVDDLKIEYVNAPSQIKLGKTQQFNCKVLNNGIEVSKDVSFSIRNEDESINVYATIESAIGVNCVVKATTNTTYRNKYFYLKCSLVEDSSVFVENKVKIQSLV